MFYSQTLMLSEPYTHQFIYPSNILLRLGLLLTHFPEEVMAANLAGAGVRNLTHHLPQGPQACIRDPFLWIYKAFRCSEGRTQGAVQERGKCSWVLEPSEAEVKIWAPQLCHWAQLIHWCVLNVLPTLVI